MALPLNGKDEGGVISSETFNLTRITTIFTGLVAAFAAVEAGGSETENWAGLDGTQRVVLVVAAIGAIALISCADILGRSIASVKAENARVQFLPAAQRARRRENNHWVDGKVLALRSGPTTQLLFIDPDADPAVTWRNLSDVQVFD